MKRDKTYKLLENTDEKRSKETINQQMHFKIVERKEFATIEVAIVIFVIVVAECWPFKQTKCKRDKIKLIISYASTEQERR